MPARPQLPESIRGCLFDMDGVLTQTATVHATAWKETFDEVLEQRDGPGYEPFSIERDYTAHVDGKPREDGVRDFLKSRDITLPDGSKDDTGLDTVYGVGNAKNKRLLAVLERDGVKVFDGSVRFIHEARDAGLKIAVVSSSANTKQALEAGGISDLFEQRVDGVRISEEGLKGKPAPDSYVRGAELLGLKPADCAVFEDALSGVAAGRAGDFGWVVGVDRVGQADKLKAEGADVVVKDLEELLS